MDIYFSALDVKTKHEPKRSVKRQSSEVAATWHPPPPTSPSTPRSSASSVDLSPPSRMTMTLSNPIDEIYETKLLEVTPLPLVIIAVILPYLQEGQFSYETWGCNFYVCGEESRSARIRRIPSTSSSELHYRDKELGSYGGKSCCYACCCLPCYCTLALCFLWFGCQHWELYDRSLVFQKSGDLVISQKEGAMLCVEKQTLKRERVKTVKGVYKDGKLYWIQIGLHDDKTPLTAKCTKDDLYDIREFLWGNNAKELGPTDKIELGSMIVLE